MEFRIAEKRKELNMTQEDLARKANVSRATIAGIECGSIKVTTTETLIKIASALDSKVSDIFLD